MYDFARGRTILREAFASVIEQLCMSAQSELGEFYDEYVAMILDEFKTQKQGWYRIASKECWTGEDLVGKPEHCIVKGACAEAFRSGQLLEENKDFFTSRWALWKHHKGEHHSKKMGYQLLDTKNSAISSRVLRNRSVSNPYGAAAAPENDKDIAAQSVADRLRHCEDACWAMLLEDLRLECTAKAVERVLNAPLVSPPFPTLALPGAGASNVRSELILTSPITALAPAETGGVAGAGKEIDYAARRRERLKKEAQAFRDKNTSDGTNTNANGNGNVSTLSPLAAVRRYDPALLDVQIDSAEYLQSLAELRKSRLHGFTSERENQGAGQKREDSDDSGFDSENEGVVDRESLQRLSVDLKQSPEKWFGQESSDGRKYSRTKKESKSKNSKGLRNIYEDIYGDSGRGSTMCDALEMQEFGGWKNREKLLNDQNQARETRMQSESQSQHAQLPSAGPALDPRGRGRAISMEPGSSGKDSDYNPLHWQRK